MPLHRAFPSFAWMEAAVSRSLLAPAGGTAVIKSCGYRASCRVEDR